MRRVSLSASAHHLHAAWHLKVRRVGVGLAQKARRRELVRELVRVDLWPVPNVALRSALHSRSGDGDESRGSSPPTGVLVTLG